MFAPASGLLREIDLDPDIPNTHKGGQDFIGAWNVNTGQFAPGFPAVDDDLSFITGETVGDITGEAPKQEVVAGTAANDLEAYNAAGLPASSSWPKLTGGWTVATPTLGSLGTIDTSSSAKKDVVSITREGTLSVYGTPASACSPSSWPNFHHDIANSGDYTRDAVPPGVPLEASITDKTLHWTAPGNELMCGTAVSYQIVTSDNPITPENFASATPLTGAPTPAEAGTAQSYALPSNAESYVAIRAIGEQENIGLPAVVAPPCTKLIGTGGYGTGSARQNLETNLNTSLSGKQVLDFKWDDGEQRLRLTHLNSASCLVTASEGKFSGQGQADIDMAAGYEVSFSVVLSGGHTYLTVVIEKEHKVVDEFIDEQLIANHERIS
jgi:hypothetical protein